MIVTELKTTDDVRAFCDALAAQLSAAKAKGVRVVAGWKTRTTPVHDIAGLVTDFVCNGTDLTIATGEGAEELLVQQAAEPNW